MRISLACLFLFAGIAWADGIPVSDGRVTEAHTVLELSDSQAEEVDVLGSLTLSPGQFAQLRAIGPSCPKRFEAVVPVTWNDCTCDMNLYAIQLSRQRVAVLHSQIEVPAARVLEEILKEQDDLYLHVDRRGQFHHGGVLIPFPRVLELIGESSGKARPGNIPEELQLSVELPVGLDRNSPVLKGRLDQLRDAASKRGWNFFPK
jgi:hypothetical protein